MRVYYLPTGEIVKITRDIDSFPEDSPKTTINVPYLVIEIDERYNRGLVFKLIRNKRGAPEFPLPDRFKVQAGQLIDNDTNEVATVVANPQKVTYKLSVFAGATPEQIDTYIENNITNLATAKEFLKKLTRVTQLLLRETRFED